MNFEIGKVYTFNTKSPVFLGAVIERAKLKSIVDIDVARTMTPIDQLWAQIYPTLPTGTPNTPKASIYYVFEGLNKTRIVVADVWVVESSIQVIEHVTITATIPSASLNDVDVVRLALSAAGLKDFAITIS